jgi:protocatechuate 3,4-dioxygenase alpha subunit
MSDAPRLIATSSQTVGPFFHFALTVNEALGILVAPGVAGEHIELTVCVRDGAGDAVPDAIVEIYQADAAGQYPSAADPSAAFTGFGRLPTGTDGCCLFRTVKPGAVPAEGTAQAAHINVCLLARGLLRQIYTRIYFHGDPALTTDPILALVPEERRATLIAEPDRAQPGAWTFVIRMQGSEETVFFDL